MNLTSKQWQTISHSLRVAAQRYEEHVRTIRTELHSAHPSHVELARTFLDQMSEAYALADDIDRRDVEAERRMYLVTEEPGGKHARAVSLAALLRDNADDEDLCAQFWEMEIGQTDIIGGGAAAEFRVVRLQDAEAI